LLSNIYDQQDGLGYRSRRGPGTSIFDLDAIIFTMILLLPQLALTEIVAGLYGAVVYAASSFHLFTPLLTVARQAEQAKTFLKAESRSKVSVYVSRPVIYSLQGNNYSE
jgi:uncharacterized protein (DUF58 family)